MENILNKLSRKFLIITKSRKSNGEIKVENKQIRFPYICYKNTNFTEVPNIKVKNKKTFSFCPTTKITTKVKPFVKKEDSIVETEERRKAPIYIPMKHSSDRELSFDHSYNSLMKALQNGIYSMFTEEVYLENEKKINNLSNKYDEMSKELQNEVDKRVVGFLDDFDAFEIRLDSNVPYFANVEDMGGLVCELNTAYFYKFDENSPTYQSDIAGIKSAVTLETYMVR